MLQGSVLPPLRFLIYINDLHNAITLSQSFHFADDTCLLNIQNIISKINRSLNKNLKELSFWVNANKIALNVAKTEVILFKTKHKTYDTDLRLKSSRKRLYKTNYLRYLGIKTDENLNWKFHIHNLASKLNGAHAILAKLRHFVNSEILRSTYFAIFHSHLKYVSLLGGLQDILNKSCLFSKKKHYQLWILHLLMLTQNLNSKIVIFWSLLML